MKSFFKRYPLFLSVIFSLCSIYSPSAAQTISATYDNPTTCDGRDGVITLHGLTTTTSYQVTYQINAVTVNPVSISSDATGDLQIDNLKSGSYSHITASSGTNSPTVAQTITLTDNCIGKQATKFAGATYANFTGIQDDDPSGFAQIYVRLSQPLNKYQGVPDDAKFWKRVIWLRNFLFQLTYANTDNFKMYTFDSLNNKYVNRLDLLAHAYFHGNVTVNIFTFLLPQNWKNNKGEMAHIYFDLITSFLATSVTDTLAANNAATTKTYNIKSNLYGLNLRGIFSSVLDTRFSIELGVKKFWIFPSSNTINPNLNPQGSNIRDLYIPQNASKNFLTQNKNVQPYYELDAQVQYNTGNVQTNSSSNIFLRYNYVSNYRKSTSENYHNNYFQFQIGYVLDISKLFYPAASSGTGGTTQSNATPANHAAALLN